MPAVSPVVLTVAETAPVPVPDDGLTDSQVAVLLAVQDKVPVPEFVMLRV